MSAADKNVAARGWLFAEELLAEEDDERLARLPPEELRAELERRGVRPAAEGKEWNAKEMIAEATARAEKEVAPPPVTAALTLLTAPEPAAPLPTIAPVIPIRKTRRNVALTAVAACVGFLVILVVHFQANNDVGRGPLHSRRDAAEVARDMAEANCARNDWAACKDKLDEAATLDPEGESDPRVQKARAEIAVAMAGHSVDAGGAEKPRR